MIRWMAVSGHTTNRPFARLAIGTFFLQGSCPYEFFPF
jgi:hypothetical protein